jgi:hypothetical protein
MTEGIQAARRPARAPQPHPSRRRWAVVGGVAACWVLLEVVVGSAVSATVLLVAIAGLGAGCVGGLRALGITRDHPWLRRLASRPWRDGQDVLKVAMRHLSDVFVVTPSGSLLAPNAVELQLNPDDLASLCERMELGVISASMTEVYGRAGPTCASSRPGPSRRAATACGNRTWRASMPGPTCLMSGMRTSRRSSRRPPRSMATPGPAVAPGRDLTRA